MSSIENLGYALQDVCLDIAYSMIDAINDDPIKNRMDLEELCEEMNCNLHDKEIDFFKVYVDRHRNLDIEVFKQDDSDRSTECDNSRNVSSHHTKEEGKQGSIYIPSSKGNGPSSSATPPNRPQVNHGSSSSSS